VNCEDFFGKIIQVLRLESLKAVEVVWNFFISCLQSLDQVKWYRIKKDIDLFQCNNNLHNVRYHKIAEKRIKKKIVKILYFFKFSHKLTTRLESASFFIEIDNKNKIEVGYEIVITSLLLVWLSSSFSRE
jgi:hypothetical protein